MLKISPKTMAISYKTVITSVVLLVITTILGFSYQGIELPAHQKQVKELQETLKNHIAIENERSLKYELNAEQIRNLTTKLTEGQNYTNQRFDQIYNLLLSTNKVVKEVNSAVK